MKCFVTICAKLFIEVSHINALHNWPTGRLFHTPFPRGCFHALPALFFTFLSFPGQSKGSRTQPAHFDWNFTPCLLLPSVSGFVFLLLLFFFSIIFGSGADYIATISWSSCLLLFPLLAQSQLKTHCDQSHDKPYLDFNGIFLSVVDLQKQCKVVCMCVVVVGGGRAGGRVGDKNPSFLK